MIRYLTIFFFILLSSFIDLKAQVHQEWVGIYNISSQGNDVTSDSSGNIYVVGNQTNSGILTIKYNSSGQEMWSRIASVQGVGIEIETDLNQDILICGFDVLSNFSILLKFNSSGDTLWSRRYQRPQSAIYGPINMKIDYDGSIYLSLVTAYAGVDDITVLKYLSNGDFQWARNFSYDPIYHDNAKEISLGADNFFYVTGFSYYPNDLIGLVIKFDKISGDTVWVKKEVNFSPIDIVLDKHGMIYTTGNKNENYYTNKIDPDGKTVWNRVYSDSGGTPKKIGIDTNNNIYVSGYQYDKARITSIKYNFVGDLLWSKTQYGANSTFCYLSGLIVDESGNSYIGGSMTYLIGYREYLTYKYNTDGNLIWISRYNQGGIDNNFLYSITKDRFDNIIVTGSGNNRPTSYSTTIKYSQTVGVNNISSQIPVSTDLAQNYPNPFNPTTNLEFGISEFGFVSLKVYDVLGNEIETLVNENKSAGRYSVFWNAENYPSGVYFYKLSTTGGSDNFSEVKKMTLLK